MAFAIVVLLITRAFWDLSRSVWFWLASFSTVAIHALIVLLIPWPDSKHARGLLALGIPDLFLVYGYFKLMEKLTTRRHPTN